MTQFGKISFNTSSLPVRAQSIQATRFFAPTTSPAQPPAAIPAHDSSHEQVNPFLLPPEQAYLAWPLGIPVSFHFHLSTDPSGHVFAPNSEDMDLPHFVWYNITFGDWSEVRTLDYDLHLPEVRRLSSVLNSSRAGAELILASPFNTTDLCGPTFFLQKVTRTPTHRVQSTEMIQSIM